MPVPALGAITYALCMAHEKKHSMTARWGLIIGLISLAFNPYLSISVAGFGLSYLGYRQTRLTPGSPSPAHVPAGRTEALVGMAVSFVSAILYLVAIVFFTYY